MGLKTKIRKLLGKSTTRPPVENQPSGQSLQGQFPDVKPQWLQTYLNVKPMTMTSPERIFAVCQAVEHVVANSIEGDFVECGVWRGGSSMAMARTLNDLGCNDRKLWLYDTFQGMTDPTANDVDCFGNPADQLLNQDQSDRLASESIWCQASLNDVKQNLAKVSYPSENFRLVVGKVEDTIPQQVPESIAVLRLDTDWFESTWHELIHLYPRLKPGGVLIIDDYGHWQGCREAVDQYMAKFAPQLFLHRIDYTGRIAIKP